MKGKFRIGGAIVLGVVIILGAFYMSKRGDTSSANAAVVTTAPERTYIPDEDTNQNGIPDWKESLTADLFESIAAPSASGTYAGSREEYRSPDTVTGKFSEAFLQNYLDSKVKSGNIDESVSDDEKLKFVNEAVSSLQDAVKSKTYSERDIVIVPQNLETMRDYGNRIAAIILDHPVNKDKVVETNEAYVLYTALQAKDASLLKGLEPQRLAYEAMVRDTQRVETPQALVSAHLDLLNAYEGIITDNKAMGAAFTDPLFTITRMKQYEEDAIAMANALHTIITILGDNGVAYAGDEKGSFLYKFKK